jgi:dihydrofolate reductase
VARLVYSAITSLDGCTADRRGEFGWAAPDEEVHAFVNDLLRPVGTHLYGRRMYEVMAFWERPQGEAHDVTDDFARIWQAAQKVVYSTTLEAPTTARTRLERTFDPAAVRRLVDDAAQDVTIGGPTIAAHALRAGVVDELQQLVTPVVVGGGTRWLPDDLRLDLELVEERRFACGVVFLRYAVRR